MNSGLSVEAALEMLGGGLSHCLTDDMRRRFGLGGFCSSNRFDMFFHAFPFPVSSFFAMGTRWISSDANNIINVCCVFCFVYASVSNIG